EGVAWGESSGCMFCAVGAFFRPGYVNAIGQAWLPALDGVAPKLQAGAKVADVGCGVGFSTLLMAEAFPKSSFVGFDFHGPSIDQANAHARAHGMGISLVDGRTMKVEANERTFWERLRHQERGEADPTADVRYLGSSLQFRRDAIQRRQPSLPDGIDIAWTEERANRTEHAATAFTPGHPL